MEFDEYIWKKKIKVKDIARETGISMTTLSLIRFLKTTPRLDTAMKIFEYTNGVVTLKELLPRNKR